DPDRGTNVIVARGVHEDSEVRTHEFADRRHGRDVVLRGGADSHLQAPEAALHGAPGTGKHAVVVGAAPFRPGRRHTRGVHEDPVAVGAAQQPVDGFARRLADDVPQRDVHAAHRLEQEPALVAAQPHGREQRLPDDLDLAGVGAEELVAQEVVDYRHGYAGGYRRLGLAPPHDAGVGLDAHQARVYAG